MQTFLCGTRLFFGAHALDALETLGAKRVLLVTDRFFTKNGTTDRVCAKLPGAQVKVFAEVCPDPPLTLIAQGVQVVQELQPDTVLALGGGSAIDCAKGIVSLSASDARLVAIPTTSGTGSEVTSFAILTHEGVKHPLVEDRIRPAWAILDDSLLQALPRSLIADAGMDVLSHCLEAVAAKNASPVTDALAMSAFRTALHLLPASFDGKTDVRREIHIAATMAGLAFDNAGLGICHALSHALGGAFHVAHGRLNGILLPHVLRFNAEAAHEPYARLAAFCGLSGPHGLIFALQRLRSRLRLPATLTEAGIAREELLKAEGALCQAALRDPCGESNPRPVTEEALRSLLRSAL